MDSNGAIEIVHPNNNNNNNNNNNKMEKKKSNGVGGVVGRRSVREREIYFLFSFSLLPSQIYGNRTAGFRQG